jgi:hypothetical protein
MITTQLDARLAVAIGSEVVCRDGRTGHVRRLVIEPESRRVTDLVVEHGLLRHRVVVPIACAEQTEGTVIRLRIDKHQLAALPPYMAVDFVRPDPAWTARHGDVPDDLAADRWAYGPWDGPSGIESAGVLVRSHLHTGLSDSQIPIGPGTRVARSSELIGYFDRVLLDPTTHAICTLVVREGHIRTKEVQVPAGQVMWITEGEIRVDTDAEL